MPVDMSPKAVKARLKLVSQLWRLSVSLGRAKQETDARRRLENSRENTVINFGEKV